METKVLNIAQCDLKFAENEGEFTGYGSVFDVEDHYKDIIIKGAFDKIIKTAQQVKLYVNHDWLNGALPIGVWSDLKQDDHGLTGTAKIETRMQKGKDAYWAIKSNLVNGLSIGFRVGEFEKRDGGGRIIKSFDALKEISIVDEPANERAQITSIKSIDEIRDELESIDSMKSLEAYLRESGGYSKSAATALISKCKSIIAGEQQSDEMQNINDRINQLLNRIKS